MVSLSTVQSTRSPLHTRVAIYRASVHHCSTCSLCAAVRAHRLRWLACGLRLLLRQLMPCSLSLLVSLVPSFAPFLRSLAIFAVPAQPFPDGPVPRPTCVQREQRSRGRAAAMPQKLGLNIELVCRVRRNVQETQGVHEKQHIRSACRHHACITASLGTGLLACARRKSALQLTAANSGITLYRYWAFHAGSGGSLWKEPRKA